MRVIAPEGQIWVCAACGKTTKDNHGNERGWDESCMLNAVLCHEQQRVNPETGLVEWVAVEAQP